MWDPNLSLSERGKVNDAGYLNIYPSDNGDIEISIRTMEDEFPRLNIVLGKDDFGDFFTAIKLFKDSYEWPIKKD
jgi:hypothetical protein